MPHYEFYCHACRKTFTKILTLVAYEEGGVVCPHCGSHKVEQCWLPTILCPGWYVLRTRKCRTSRVLQRQQARFPLVRRRIHTIPMAT